MKYRYGVIAVAAIMAASAMPLSAMAASNEISIDYKDSEADDIVITEAQEGMFEEGSLLIFAVEKIDVMGDITCHIENGDIEITAELLDRDELLNLFKDSEKLSDMKKISFS